jgi:hypothetical protein
MLTLKNILIVLVAIIACVLIWIDNQPDPHDNDIPTHNVSVPKPFTITQQPPSPVSTSVQAPKEEKVEEKETQIFTEDYFLNKYTVEIQQTQHAKTHNTIELQFSGKDKIIQFDHGVLLYPSEHQASTAMQDHAKNPPKLFDGVVPAGLDTSMIKVTELVPPFSILPDVLLLKGPKKVVKDERNKNNQMYAHLEQARVMFRTGKIVHDISTIVIEEEIDALQVINDAVIAIIK